jgi:hypothetical protein
MTIQIETKFGGFYGTAMNTLNGQWADNDPTNTDLPGRLFGTVFPTPTAQLTYAKSVGLDHVRLEGAWERLQPSLNGPLGEALLDYYPADVSNPLRNPVAYVKDFLDRALAAGLRVHLCLCFNYGGRYVGFSNGVWGSKTFYKVGSPQVPISAFEDYCTRLAKAFGSHPAVSAIELMNEAHNMPGPGDAVYVAMVQAGINAVAAVKPTLPIIIDGYQYASASNWVGANPTLHTVTHPVNDRLLIFAAHQYNDDNETGTYAGTEATTPNGAVDRYVTRIQPFLTWLSVKGFSGQGIINEFGAPNTPAHAERVRQMIVAAKAAGVRLTSHFFVPYTNDPNVLNLFPPSTDSTDRRITKLMQSGATGTSYLTTPITT